MCKHIKLVASERIYTFYMRCDGTICMSLRQPTATSFHGMITMPADAINIKIGTEFPSKPRINALG